MRVLKGQPRGPEGANENAQRGAKWDAAKATSGNLAGGLAQRRAPTGKGGNSGVSQTHVHVLYY